MLQLSKVWPGFAPAGCDGLVVPCFVGAGFCLDFFIIIILFAGCSCCEARGKLAFQIANPVESGLDLLFLLAKDLFGVGEALGEFGVGFLLAVVADGPVGVREVVVGNGVDFLGLFCCWWADRGWRCVELLLGG